MKPLKAKAVVVFEGVDIYAGKERMASMTADEALDLYRSLKRNLKRIRKNELLWKG